MEILPAPIVPPADAAFSAMHPKSVRKLRRRFTSPCIRLTRLVIPEQNPCVRPNNKVACARVPHRVRSMDIAADAQSVVTCGEGGVTMWAIPSELEECVRDADAHAGMAGERSVGGEEDEGLRERPASPVALEGQPAILVDELGGQVFVDVACSRPNEEGNSDTGVVCVTSRGILCCFSR